MPLRQYQIDLIQVLKKISAQRRLPRLTRTGNQNGFVISKAPCKDRLEMSFDRIHRLNSSLPEIDPL